MNRGNTLERKGNIGQVIILHLAGWLLFSSLPVLFGFHGNSFDWYGLKRFFTHVPLLFIFFYLNYFILIPRLFTTGKYWWYAFSVVLSLVLLGGLYELADQIVKLTPPPDRIPRGLHPRPFRYISFFGVFNGMVAFAISTSIRITNEWLKNERQRKELENQNLKSELSFLKSQVNPHFLFNTLNNIYSLSLGKSDQAPEAIMKLSQMLRYMLYETDDKGVSLEREIAYLEDYISLQRMRVSDQVQISFDKEGEFRARKISPLLLIPFVENAFKHGIHAKHASYVKILLSVDAQRLNFQVINSVPPNASELPKDKASGIGLVNVAKRLTLLYPERHRLEIKTTDKEYIVLLQLNLS